MCKEDRLSLCFTPDSHSILLHRSSLQTCWETPSENPRRCVAAAMPRTVASEASRRQLSNRPQTTRLSQSNGYNRRDW